MNSEDRYRAHRRSGYLEFLVHVLIGTSWTTMTAVVFRRSLLEKTGLFRTDVGPLADRLWAYRSALHSDTMVVPDALATWRQHPAQSSAPRFGSYSLERMQKTRALWRAIEQTVEDCLPHLPQKWSPGPSLKAKLLWTEQRHYFDSYGLTRTVLRQDPMRFLFGLGQAFTLEPVFALQRLVRGLPWQKEMLIDESAYASRLIGELMTIAEPKCTVSVSPPTDEGAC